MGSERCCENCTYALRFQTRWLRLILRRWPGLLFCFHWAEAPGEISEVRPAWVCRNFVRRRCPTVRIAAPESDDPGSVMHVHVTRCRFRRARHGARSPGRRPRVVHAAPLGERIATLPFLLS